MIKNTKFSAESPGVYTCKRKRSKRVLGGAELAARDGFTGAAFQQEKGQWLTCLLFCNRSYL